MKKKSKLRRNSLLVVVFALLVGLLAACGGGGGTAPADGNKGADSADGNAEGGGDTPDAIEFRVAWWGSVDRHELYNEIIDRYEELNPHVTIVREFAGFGDYWNRIATQSAGGNAPDIITLHTQIYGREYPDKGVLIPLDEYVERGLIDLTGWDQAIVDAGRVDGVLYSISKGVTSGSMIVNTDMIERAGGQVPPKSGITYDEFREWALQLQPNLPEGSYVVNDVGRQDSFFDTYLRNLGKSLFAPDGNSVGFEVQDLIDYWTYWNELREAGVTPPPEVTAEYVGLPWESSMFVNNINAIQFENSNQGKIFQMYMDDHVDIIRLPMVDGAPYKSGENLISSGWAITKDSDPAIRDELAKFINWFVNDEFAGSKFNAELGVVGPSYIAEKIIDTIAPTDVYAFEHMAQISADIPPSEPWAEGGSTFRQLFETAYDQLSFGQLTIEEAAQQVYDEANRMLAD